jgi:hypothetical protein
MAVPTVSSIAPTVGHTGGKTLVEIDGTNFRTPTPQVPAANGITPDAPPSVVVTFGGVPSPDVRWLSATTLWVTSPVSPLPYNAPAGPVDVVVTNVDDSGHPIVGETVTVAGGFTYQLPTLTSDNESDLARCVRAFIQELKRQITPNVAWPANTDFDDAADAVTQTALLPKMPGLVLSDLDVRENPFYSERSKVDVTSQDGTSYVELDPPTTVDLVFTIVGVTTNAVELFNLLAATKRFFRKNPYLSLQRDPTDSSKGAVEYEMDSYEEKENKLTITATSDNVKHFVIMATVRGFDIEAMSGLTLGGPAGESEGTTDAGATATDGPTLMPTGQLTPP